MHVNRFIVAPTTLNHSHRCLSSRRLTGPSSNRIKIRTMKSVWTPWFGQNDEDIAIAGPCNILSFLFWKRHRWQLLFFLYSTTLSRRDSGNDNEHRIKIHRRECVQHDRLSSRYEYQMSLRCVRRAFTKTTTTTVQLQYIMLIHNCIVVRHKLNKLFILPFSTSVLSHCDTWEF